MKHKMIRICCLMALALVIILLMVSSCSVPTAKASPISDTGELEKVGCSGSLCVYKFTDVLWTGIKRTCFVAQGINSISISCP